MAHRKNTKIKTKYKSIEECINSCGEMKEDTFWGKWHFLKEIVGKMNENGSFKLSTRERYGTAHEFVGNVKQQHDGIYLVGDIRVKHSYEIMFHVANVILNILGFWLFSQIQSDEEGYVLMKLLGIYAIGLGWFHVWYLYKSDTLYKHLLRRFASKH
ncbi:hypothetical protein [Maledivibacter halophilus]|uniref:Uncharacterized protein n=1 Tax=Maledivibacter halophilus TaxID=36842 RepID=A0A1T5KZP0_9FIRM|nr:hypothetical protein [Maledivibacter halophilus]SKC69181.1 hypothetical protein SAMN02194393_02218 [Maledivibacter halophilus]